MSVTVIDQWEIPAPYGNCAKIAIVEDMDLGRMLICQAFGRMGSLQGGRVRWEHGLAAKLKPGDTRDTLSEVVNDHQTERWQQVLAGYDQDRPIAFDGPVLARIAFSAGLAD